MTIEQLRRLPFRCISHKATDTESIVVYVCTTPRVTMTVTTPRKGDAFSRHRKRTYLYRGHIYTRTIDLLVAINTARIEDFNSSQPRPYSSTQLGNCPMTYDEAVRYERIKQEVFSDTYLPEGYRKRKHAAPRNIINRRAYATQAEATPEPMDEPPLPMKVNLGYQLPDIDGIRRSRFSISVATPKARISPDEVEQLGYKWVAALASNGGIIAAAALRKQLTGLSQVRRNNCIIFTLTEWRNSFTNNKFNPVMLQQK